MNPNATLHPLTPVPMPPAPRAPDAPDWDAVSEDIRCPLCRYDLRGLAEPRCPECGYRFRWPELLDPNLRVHPYLFEHHPERNAWSFVRTMLGGLLPRRFWRAMQPAQRIHTRRLVVYWLIAAALGFVAVATEAGRSFYSAARENERERTRSVRAVNRQLRQPPGMYEDRELFRWEVDEAGGAQGWVDAHQPPWFSPRFVGSWYRRFPLRQSFSAPVLYAAWPWLTLATLMIFAASMRRAKVRPLQVTRCALYCCDAGVWLVPLTAYALAVSIDAIGAMPYSELLGQRGQSLLAAPVFAALTTYRLTAAYALYLRFHWPLATVVASQLVVTSLAIVLLLNLGFP
jgi:hypothetical protein